MSAHIFDGKAFAAKEEQKLVSVVNILKSKGITPKLVTLNLTNDPASKLYLNLKRKAAERVGCKLLVVNLKSLIKPDEVIKQIQKFNKDKSSRSAFDVAQAQ